MLLTSQISSVQLHSPEWIAGRLGRFTSSEIHALMGEKEFTTGAMSYIYRKVGEELSGVPANEPFETAAMQHGNVYEIEAIRKYAEREKIEYLVTQRMVNGNHERFSCTPDAIKILSAVSGQEAYNVHPIEVKCPLTYDAFISLALCESAQDVKARSKQYYYQLLDQMLNCGALTGTFLVYHPFFKSGQMKAIDFRIMEPVTISTFKDKPYLNHYPMKEDYDLLKERKLSAVRKFEEIKARMEAL